MPGTALTGAGQNVGLLEFDGYFASDIAAYRNQFGLPAIPLINVAVDRGVNTPGPGNSEVSLDIEMVMSMAPGVTTIYVFEAPNPSPWEDLLNVMVTNIGIKQFSCSWGGGNPNPSAEAIFKQMAAQGQSFFNASGDSNAFCSASGAVAFPCESTNITQVGGTTLTTTGAGGNYLSEMVWNSGAGVGSSGGVSTTYAIPDWQQGISMVANYGSTTMRNIPDVALTADNVYVTYGNGSSGPFRGTSCAAPLWAGFAALANEQAVANSQSTVGFINPAIYQLAKSGRYAADFHDITVGNNANTTCGSTMYPAVAGYDLATGLGTPNGQALINDLAPFDVLQITPFSRFSASGGPGGPFTISSTSFVLTNTGTNPFSWSLSNTSIWLTVSSTSGTLSPEGPAATVTASLNSVASNLAIGTYSAFLFFTNQSDQVCQSRKFDLSVISRPTIFAQPTNQTAQDGAIATLSIGANGGLPMSYQWQFNGNNLTDVGPISGSATATLCISNVAPALAGIYRAIVTNAAGMAVSSNALLVALPGNLDHFAWSAIGSPQVLNSPFAVTLTALDPANIVATNFNTSASLTAWTNSPSPLPFPITPEATAPFVNGVWSGSITPLEIASNVLLKASDASGHTGLSNPFGVISQPPLLTAQPTDQTVTVGASATFNVAATGSLPLTYSWLLNGQPISGTTNASFTTNSVPLSASGSQFSCLVSNAYGSTTSLVATLTVLVQPPMIAQQPLSLTVPVGDSASFSVSATGSLPLYYFWQGNSAFITGATNATYSTNNVQLADSGSQFGCVVSNAYGTTTSLVATLKVLGLPPTIAQQPVNQAALVGSNLAFTVMATGSPPLSYQWWSSCGALADATNSVLTLQGVTSSQAGCTFWAEVSNVYGSATSQVAMLTVLYWSSPDAFNPGANDVVYCTAVLADGKILAGGYFTALGGQSRSYLGRLNADGTLDAGFNPGADYPVYSLAVQSDGKIVVGGGFKALGGQSRSRLGRLNGDGTLDTSFNPGADGPVYSLAVQADSKIVVGGAMATLGGQGRSRLGRLNGDGTLDTSHRFRMSF